MQITNLKYMLRGLQDSEKRVVKIYPRSFLFVKPRKRTDLTCNMKTPFVSSTGTSGEINTDDT
jgi:hypothetical protein